MRIVLARVGSDKTVVFALSELRRLLKAVDNEIIIDERIYDTYDKKVTGVIWVSPVPHPDMPKAENELWDDNILIDIKNNEGMITGLNPRSVLFGVYRLAKELGIGFVRPSDDGEIIPSYSMTPISLYVCEKPTSRYRTVCIEGEVSYDHVLYMIDWLPKQGMNGYLFQFKNPYIFFERWYNHLQNGYLEKTPVTKDDVYHMYLSLCEEAHKRGIVIITGGHGFITEPMGLENDGWEHIPDSAVPEKIRPYLALRDGKRTLWRDMAIATQLCYSNPTVRESVISDFVKYCKEHSEIDCVGFSFNDGCNNHCECDECRKMQPSDFYVDYLNEIDRRLTDAGCKIKIMLSTYQDNLWAPVKNRLCNLSRFILKLAPMTRNYKNGYADIDMSKLPETNPYVRNALLNPENTDEFFSYYKLWHDKYPTLDSTLFDYHLMWNHRRDFGYVNVAKLIFDDMLSLKNVWLNGLISCQLGRCAFPNNFAMQMMADGLWCDKYDFDSQIAKYCKSAYGKYCCAVKDYFEKMSKYFDCRNLHFAAEGDDLKKDLYSIDRAEQTVYEFEPTVKEALENTKGNLHKSFEYLLYHTELMHCTIPVFRAVVRGEVEKQKELANKASEFARRSEMKVHKVFDTCQFVNLMDNIVVNNKKVL